MNFGPAVVCRWGTDSESEKRRADNIRSSGARARTQTALPKTSRVVQKGRLQQRARPTSEGTPGDVEPHTNAAAVCKSTACRQSALERTVGERCHA